MQDTIHLAYEDEFKEWMRESKSYNDSTIITRVNNVVRIENAYGTLIDKWKKDRFDKLFDLLRYSKTDELLNRKYPEPLKINGNSYNDLATYRAALRLYAAFLSTQKAEELGYPFGEIGEKVHKALIQLSQGCLKKTKYSQEDVKQHIIKPLAKYLNNELSSLGYRFCIEKVVPLSNSNGQTRDRYDIYGESDDKPIVIIEVDTYRADQISKKLVSRLSFNLDSELLYVSLVYPNDHENKDAEKKECRKYFSFASEIFSMFSSPKKHFISHWLF